MIISPLIQPAFRCVRVRFGGLHVAKMTNFGRPCLDFCARSACILFGVCHGLIVKWMTSRQDFEEFVNFLEVKGLYFGILLIILLHALCKAFEYLNPRGKTKELKFECGARGVRQVMITSVEARSKINLR
jgi:hypothetical protein